MYEKMIEPRVSETDGVGHINNTTVPVWFEAARNEIFKLFTYVNFNLEAQKAERIPDSIREELDKHLLHNETNE